MYGMLNETNDFTVFLEGELDHCRAESLRDAVDKTLSNIRNCRVVFDMSGVSFMDSSGVGFIIGRYKRIIANGCIAVIRNPKMHIDKLLEMAGIYKIIRKE